jgi:uncharacterized protein YbaR (Trm112 family)
MIEPDFLRMLVCPSTHQPLREATAAELAAVNAAVAAGTARNRGGVAVAGSLQGGLVPADGSVVYPIKDGIPILLVPEAIPLATAGERRGGDGEEMARSASSGPRAS